MTATAVPQQITVEALGLPTVRTEVSEFWKDQTFIMSGSAKIGKTDFWAQGEKNFFIKTEQGHQFIKHLGLDARDWNELTGIISKLKKAAIAGIFPYETVIIDTGDRWLQLVDHDVIEWGQNKYKSSEVNSIGDVPNGNGWAGRTNRINLFLKEFESLPCAKGFIFHMDVDVLKDEGGEYKKETINCGGKAGRSILAWPNHHMHIKSKFVGDQLVRKVLLRPTKFMDAGSRGILPTELSWTNDSKKNYDTLRAYFK